MVQNDPQVTTRLQSRVDSLEEKTEANSAQLKDLHMMVTSMKEMLRDLPSSIEKIVQREREKRPQHNTDGFEAASSIPTVTVDDEIRTEEKPPPPELHKLLRENHFEKSLFALPKVELPLFDGTDPRGWLTKAELYFQVHRTPISHKIQLTQMRMDGEALNWFTNLLIKQPHTTWGGISHQVDDPVQWNQIQECPRSSWFLI